MRLVSSIPDPDWEPISTLVDSIGTLLPDLELGLASFPTIYYKCHRPVVHQGHVHMRGKYTHFNRRPACPQIGRDLFIEALGQARRSGFVKTGTTSVGGSTQQGELRNQQHPATCIHQRAIHLPLFIGENAEGLDLVDQIPDIRLIIAFRHAQQDQEAALYLAYDLFIHLYRSVSDSLENGFHQLALPSLQLSQGPFQRQQLAFHGEST